VKSRRELLDSSKCGALRGEPITESAQKTSDERSQLRPCNGCRRKNWTIINDNENRDIHQIASDAELPILKVNIANCHGGEKPSRTSRRFKVRRTARKAHHGKRSKSF